MTRVGWLRAACPWLLLLGGLSLMIAGCAGGGGAKQALRPGSAEKLVVGMSVDEVKALMGEPDDVVQMEFGRAIGHAWNAVVYRYYATDDPLYRHAGRKLTNTLVFCVTDKGPCLDHWRLESAGAKE